MNIGATLLGQMITFMVFVWFTMKYVWPPLTRAMDERRKTISDGLAAAERGVYELNLAQQKATQMLREARQQAGEIIDHANKNASVVIEEAKDQAKLEAKQIMSATQAEIQQAVDQAKHELRSYLAELALASTEKLLQRNIDQKINESLVEKMIAEI